MGIAAAAWAGRDGADLGAHLPAFRRMCVSCMRRPSDALAAAGSDRTCNGAGRAVPLVRGGCGNGGIPRPPRTVSIVANRSARTAETCRAAVAGSNRYSPASAACGIHTWLRMSLIFAPLCSRSEGKARPFFFWRTLEEPSADVPSARLVLNALGHRSQVLRQFPDSRARNVNLSFFSRAKDASASFPSLHGRHNGGVE